MARLYGLRLYSEVAVRRGLSAWFAINGTLPNLTQNCLTGILYFLYFLPVA